MKRFPDTSVLCAIYRTQVNSLQADTYIADHPDPLSVSPLVLLEFRQSVHFQIWLNQKDRTRGFSRSQGLAMLQNLQVDLNTGLLNIVPADWSDVHRQTEMLSAKHTEANGHRLIDILHVATALHLGAAEFLTFDLNQKVLAESEGLIAPL